MLYVEIEEVEIFPVEGGVVLVAVLRSGVMRSNHNRMPSPPFFPITRKRS